MYGRVIAFCGMVNTVWEEKTNSAGVRKGDDSLYKSEYFIQTPHVYRRVITFNWMSDHFLAEG